MISKVNNDSYLDYLLDLDGRVDVHNLLNLHRHWHLNGRVDIDGIGSVVARAVDGAHC